MNTHRLLTRRDFLSTSAAAIAAATLPSIADDKAAAPEPIIDIHQHTNFSGRTDSQLIAHQRAMGITTTILLPAGRNVNRPSTHNGSSNGLAAKCTGNEACYHVAEENPKEFMFGSNEVPDIEDAIPEIEKWLKKGAVCIAELKFNVECDSPEMQKIYQLAQEYNVPLLMHWEYKRYNHGFDRFYKMLEKFPKANFIGHAQAWWANIDKDYRNEAGLYPKGRVTPGGITDRYLSNYPNMFGDFSAGSGLNAMTRDEDHARDFMNRHQDQLMFGSDCNDTIGRGLGCTGSQAIAAIRRIAPTKEIERKILFGNAKKLYRLPS